ncbi:hypothetical protein MUK42_31005 [Musa troglodytarum]|uniref:Uncharacterized protein n=1 Tax=Musa troglodytarum TaxID=320322 RepID=A0A9E7FJS8_9LILI|nr:hypothetical protein MUK42_31005 [Musa troglodytarum]
MTPLPVSTPPPPTLPLLPPTLRPLASTAPSGEPPPPHTSGSSGTIQQQRKLPQELNVKCPSQKRTRTTRGRLTLKGCMRIKVIAMTLSLFCLFVKSW